MPERFCRFKHASNRYPKPGFKCNKVYTERGKVTISAGLQGDNIVGITVKDTGIGMNSEMLDNMFCLDAKNNRPGTNGEPSTGLGLLLYKEFIEKHGGRIVVESEEGKGTIFHFTLPHNAE